MYTSNNKSILSWGCLQIETTESTETCFQLNKLMGMKKISKTLTSYVTMVVKSPKSSYENPSSPIFPFKKLMLRKTCTSNSSLGQREQTMKISAGTQHQATSTLIL